MPSIHTVYGKMKQTGLTVLLIDIKESRSTVEAAVKERGYTLPVLLDSDGAVTQAYGAIATPTILQRRELWGHTTGTVLSD